MALEESFQELDVSQFRLHRECERGNLLAVQQLIGQGTDKDELNEEGVTALFMACKMGHLSIVEYLVKQGANKEKTEVSQLKPLGIACEKGHLPIVRYLAEQGADKGSVDQYGRTPLFIACQYGHLAVVQYLIGQGANKDQGIPNQTPVSVACCLGHLPIVQYLVEQGADKNKADQFGRTPLYFACQKGHLQVVQYLIEQGADKNKVTQNEDDIDIYDLAVTAFFIACQKGHLQVVQYLIEQGVDKDKANQQGETPLYITIERNHIAIVALLLAYGAQYTDEWLTKGIVRRNAAVVELFAAAQSWPLPVDAYRRRMCGLDWLACYFKQKNSGKEGDETVFFENWRKQFEIGRACLMTLLVLATSRTIEDKPRYLQCGLYRLPPELLFHLIHQGALAECPEANPPIENECVNLSLPEYHLQACRMMGFWSIPTRGVLPRVSEEKKIEEIDEEVDVLQATSVAAGAM